MSTPEPERTYETATARLEEIIKRLDSDEAGLRETLDLVKEGRTLVEFCAAELDAVGRGLEELRLEELVARLEEVGRAQDDALLNGLFARQGLTPVEASESFRAEFYHAARSTRERLGARTLEPTLLQRVLTLLADFRAIRRGGE